MFMVKRYTKSISTPTPHSKSFFNLVATYIHIPFNLSKTLIMQRWVNSKKIWNSKRPLNLHISQSTKNIMFKTQWTQSCLQRQLNRQFKHWLSTKVLFILKIALKFHRKKYSIKIFFLFWTTLRQSAWTKSHHLMSCKFWRAITREKWHNVLEI